MTELLRIGPTAYVVLPIMAGGDEEKGGAGEAPTPSTISVPTFEATIALVIVTLPGVCIQRNWDRQALKLMDT